MKAFAVWPNEERSGVVDVDEPELASPTAVKVRILDVGVCGTDAELCAFAYGEPPAGEEFLITGHEALGEVVEVGDEVEWLDAGDLVVPSVRRPCARRDCP
ncbi:MAG TPA: alcohol dehydrogenase catalytic domain-containing protein, partial [Gemmatimonadaceae bacterium]|nr:alcohol dehydrogenase catalytic domain-containing protein [Gemmatimonadaceae bacterium]